jgi:O-antigen/teichoic acid export membrane protein
MPGTDKMELTARPLSMLRRLLALFRLRPFDTATEAGRSKERLRRAGLTTLSSGAARGVGILASLITVPLTYRYLGPEQYGLWMVLASIIAAMGFADLGIGLGLVNAISEAYGKDDRELARRYFTSAFGMLLAIAILLTVAGAIAYPFVPWMRLFNVKSPAVAAEGARALLVLYAWFVINIPLDVASRVQTGFQKGYVPQMIRMIGSVATLVALLVVIALHGSLAWLVFGSTAGSVVSTVVNAWVLFYHDPWLIPALHAFHIGAAKKILHLGLMFFVLQCAVVLGYTSDNIVITQVMGAAAVAAYAVPQKLFSPIALVIGMAVTPLWPAYGEALARGDVGWVRKTFWRSLQLVLAISIPSCALLAFTGPWILRVFFGKTMHAPMSLLIVLGIWGVVSAVSSTVSVFLNGAGVLKIQAAVAVIASSTNLVLSILFTRKLGVMGVCLGSIITQLLIAHPTFAYLILKYFRTLQPPSHRAALQDITAESL